MASAQAIDLIEGTRLSALGLPLPEHLRPEQHRVIRNLNKLGTLSFPECYALAQWIRGQFAAPRQLREVMLNNVCPQTREQLLSILAGSTDVWPVPTPVQGRMLFHPTQPVSGRNRKDSVEVEFEGRTYKVAIGRMRRKMVEIIARDGNLCIWCSRELSHDHPLASVEHIIPRSKGGTADVKNLCLACSPCNEDRKHKSAIDWMTICRARGHQVREAVIWQRLEVMLLG